MKSTGWAGRRDHGGFCGAADLAAKLVVGPDGRITLPLAGDVMLAG